MRTIKKLSAAVAVASALTLTAACGGTAEDTAGGGGESASQQETPMEEKSMEKKSMDSMDSMASGLVGPGCADYAKAVPDGAGSVKGMSQDPVAVAASNNPLLKTLTAAVSGQLNPKVDLVDTLNGDEFTVFAPVDEAFAQLPKKTVTALSKPANAQMLTDVLTYHVVPGQVTPDQIAGSTQTSVQGGDVKVTGSGDNLKVNDASVICGGVETANATVYLVDGVLSPQM